MTRRAPVLRPVRPVLSAVVTALWAVLLVLAGPGPAFSASATAPAAPPTSTSTSPSSPTSTSTSTSAATGTPTRVSASGSTAHTGTHGRAPHTRTDRGHRTDRTDSLQRTRHLSATASATHDAQPPGLPLPLPYGAAEAPAVQWRTPQLPGRVVAQPGQERAPPLASVSPRLTRGPPSTPSS